MSTCLAGFCEDPGTLGCCCLPFLGIACHLLRVGDSWLRKAGQKAYLLRVAGEDVAVVVGEWVAWPWLTPSSKARVGSRNQGSMSRQFPGVRQNYSRQHVKQQLQSSDKPAYFNLKTEP